jgi:hypothetical protein
MRCVGLRHELLQGRPMGDVNARGRDRGVGMKPWARGFAAAALLCAMGLRPTIASAQDEASGDEKPTSEQAAPVGEAGLKLEQAVKQLEQLNYTEAQQTLLGIIQSGQAMPDQLAQAYFNLGIVESALDNEVEATDSFYLALMLQPSLLFPEGGSPKIRSRLNEARSRVTEVGVLEARAVVDDGVLEVQIGNDPLNLIKRIEVTMTRGGGEAGTVELQKNALRAEVESGVETIQVVFYDEAGNRLKILDVDPAAKAPEPSAVDTGGAPSVWKSWGLWAGVAGAFALGGAYFLMESSNISSDIDAAEDEDEPDLTEIARLEDDRDRVGLYGIVGLSMAGAAAATAGALLLFNDDEDASKGDSSGETAPEATLVPSFAPGHVGARFQMRF